MCFEMMSHLFFPNFIYSQYFPNFISPSPKFVAKPLYIYLLGAQEYRLIETVLLSTQLRNKKIVFNYTLLSRGSAGDYLFHLFL